MGVSITYKIFVILFAFVFFAFLLLISRRKKQATENYFYKDDKANGSVHTLPFSYEERYDTSDQQVLNKRFSSLLSTQLYYTKIATVKSQDPNMQDFARNILVAYQNSLAELKSLLTKEEQYELLFNTDHRLFINKLESEIPSNYELDFLDETIKLQFSIREVLGYLKKSTDKADLQTFYTKLIQEIEQRIDQGINLLNHV